MKKILFLLVVICLGLSSCYNKEKAIADSIMNAKVDSIVGARMNEVNAQAMDELDHRIAIEVKVKADSIIAASTPKAIPHDTARPAVIHQ